MHIKHWGIDVLGDEIFENDIILEFPNGDIVLAENIYEYVIRAISCKRVGSKIKKLRQTAKHSNLELTTILSDRSAI